MSNRIDPATRDAVERALADLDGVLHASLDSRTGDVWVVRDPAYDEGPFELAVRNRLTAVDYDPAGVAVHVTLPTSSGPRRRVRFIDAQREVVDHGRLTTITVRLEWNDVFHSGSASGESGAALELRTTASAAIQALERLTGQELGLRVIGVKAVRAFDSDLMVASVIRSERPHQPLIGAVVGTDAPLDGAAVAVLSALNRFLGNFLDTTD